MWLHTPAHHLVAEQVQYLGQVQPAFVSRDIGYVTHPHQIWVTGLEVALRQVRTNGQVVFTGCGDNKRPFPLGFNAVLLHRASHALLAHADATCHQFLPHLCLAVFLLDLGVDSPNVGQQGFIADSPIGMHQFL